MSGSLYQINEQRQEATISRIRFIPDFGVWKENSKNKSHTKRVWFMPGLQMNVCKRDQIWKAILKDVFDYHEKGFKRF